MKALVISGGGSKGAWAGGYAQRLIEKSTRPYELFMGTSTGSLLVPLLAIAEIERIREAFTSVSQSDIFSMSPFKIKRDKAGELKIGMNHLGIIGQFVKRKKTLGESLNLLNIIRKTLTSQLYAKLASGSTEAIISVSNLSKDQTEYYSSKESSYEDFYHYMWASCNVVPFMSLYNKDGMNYADGGYGCYAPIQEAIRRGARDIDVIILRTEDRKRERDRISNVFQLWLSTTDFMHQRRAEDDIALGINEAIKRHARLRIHYLPDILTENSLIFEPAAMSRWWDEGYLHCDESEPYEIGWTYHR